MAKKATINKRGNVSITITNKSICMENKDAPKFEFQTEFPEFKESEHRGMFTVHFLPINMQPGQRRGVTLICFLDSNAKPQFRVPTRIYGSAKRQEGLSITQLNSHQLKVYGKLAGVSYAKLRDASSAIMDADVEANNLRDIESAIVTLCYHGFVCEGAPARKATALPKKRGKIASPIKELI